MRHPWKLPLAVVCLLALASLPLLPAPRGAAQAVTYTVTDLGTLGGAQSTALGLDECGKVVGESTPAGSTSFHPYYWDGATMTGLGTFGGQGGMASAVNLAGRVAGSAQTSTSEQRPFVWTQAAGKTDLGTPGTGAAAYDINESNRIVGQWETSPLQDRAFVWTQATGMQIVTAPWGTPIAAYGINNAGHIVGTAQTSGGASHAFLSSGGVVTDLGTLGGTNSFAYDLNETGVVVGHANIPSNNASRPFHAFRWTSTSGMQDLGTLGGVRSIAHGVNASGQIVGYAEVSPGVNRAFLWTDDNASGAPDAGEMKNLNALAPTAGWTFEEARAINDRGQIVATAANSSGQRRAFLLTPDNVGPSPCEVPGTLQFSAATYAVGEAGTNAAVTVSRTGGSDRAVSVGYATSNGTAAAGSDYTAASGTLNFADGETSKTFNVAISDDSLDEPDETVNLTLSGPTGGATLGTQTTATLTITDNDAAPALSVNDVPVTEGDAGTVGAVFNVTLSAASAQTVTVGYATADNSATQPADYASTSGALTFNPGDTQKTVTVNVAGDTIDEPNETFFVNLSSPSNATVGDGQGTGTITDDDGASSLSVGDVIVTEGNAGQTAATFTVSLLPASGQTVTVSYATADGTATSASGDYAAVSSSLTFDPGQTSRTVTVNVNGDTVGEAHENFFLNLSSPSNATISDNQGQATVNNDDAALAISDQTLAEGNTGKTPFNFKVTLSHASINPVSVSYATSNGTAAQPDDYAAANGTLTFAAGDTEKTVTINVTGEAVFETDETFNVTLSSPTGGATVSDGTGVGTINNDDTAPSFSTSDVTVTEGNAGTRDAVFKVTLSAPSGVAASVNYATANNTAVAPDDYESAGGTLTFNPGEMTKDVTVAVKGETTFEAHESFFVNLTSPSGATINAAQGVGTITNDDAAPTFSVNDVEVTEGNTGGVVNANFIVTLSAPSGVAASVNYATSDVTAFQPHDYKAVSGTLNFAPGETSKTVGVTVVGDLLDEANETYHFNLSIATNANVGDALGVGTITDDDGAPSLSIGDPAAVPEGNTGTTPVSFTVSLLPASGQTVTVNYATANGTAVADSDFTGVSGTLTFNPGEPSKTVTVNVTGDTTSEANETFFVNLSSPTNATVTDAQGQATITNDDATPTFTIEDVLVTEGNPGPAVNAEFKVRLSAPSGLPASVNYATADGTATAASGDYTPTSGTLTFNPGDVEKKVIVAVTGDRIFENLETFYVRLSGAAGANLTAGEEGEGKIDNDEETSVVQFSHAEYTVGEAGGTVTITIVRTSGTAGGVIVGGHTRGGTATSRITGTTDYTTRGFRETFAEGETQKTFEVSVVNDTLDEPNEHFFADLFDDSFNLFGATLGATKTATVTITDDDDPPAFEFSAAAYSADENGGQAVIFLKRSGGTNGSPFSGPVSVKVSTSDGTATAGPDYTAKSITVEFTEGSSEGGPVFINLANDTLDEEDETVNLTLSDPVGGVLGAQKTAVLTIKDSPTISVGDASQTEGQGVVFTLTLSAPSQRSVSVRYSTSDGTAVAPGDYTAVSSSALLIFSPGETSKQVTVATNNDSLGEPDETFNLVLSNPQNASIADGQAVATILDDDRATLNFSQSSYPVGESAHFVTVTVARAGDASAASTVDFATGDGTATERKDYTAASGTLRFAAGETSKTFDVLLTEDAFHEPDETINLTLSNPTGGASLGTLATAEIVIAADDNPQPAENPVDNSSDFVRQHYHDFLNREPDASGLAFWVQGIESCGADAACREVKRVNTSAAFFLSIEFQETGYLVYRAFKAAYGDAASPGVAGTVPVARLQEFLPDTRRIGEGVVVGAPGWEATLEANKNAYMLEFVRRQRFTDAYPTALTPAQFVNALFSNAGVTPSAAEQQADIDEFGGATTSADAAARARALRRVAEHPSLVQAELRRAYVLMQYFGYLRRNPDDAPEPGLNFGGWNFWLGKLNEFGGDAVRAEMVKAFLDSSEYRSRFGQ